MPRRWTAASTCSVLLVLALPRCVLSIRADKSISRDEHVSATVNATVLDSKGNPVQMMTNDDGTYGQDSPKADTRGIVVAPAPYHGVVDRQGCDPHTRFVVPPRTVHWVALLQRGNCTFKEKILKAAAYNASAVLIYNNSTERTVRMGHEGTGNTVAVMITETYGKEILAHLDHNLTVLVSVVVGQRGPTKNNNRGSLVFVSISFIVLMIISSAWLIFYFIQKIRYTSARDRSQRRLGDAAKKAIGKLTTRTVKKGDKTEKQGPALIAITSPSVKRSPVKVTASPAMNKTWTSESATETESFHLEEETDPDFNHCAVCIEGYQLNDVVRILPCKHVFHKMCVDPWLNEHCTCPMCKLNILKALGIMPNLPCVDNGAFDMDRIGRSQTSGSQRTALVDLTGEASISIEPLRHPGAPQIPSDGEMTPRTGEINIAVTSGHFFNRNSMSPRSVVCEMELPDIQASLDLYDENKS